MTLFVAPMDRRVRDGWLWRWQLVMRQLLQVYWQGHWQGLTYEQCFFGCWMRARIGLEFVSENINFIFWKNSEPTRMGVRENFLEVFVGALKSLKNISKKCNFSHLPSLLQKVYNKLVVIHTSFHFHCYDVNHLNGIMDLTDKAMGVRQSFL